MRVLFFGITIVLVQFITLLSPLSQAISAGVVQESTRKYKEKCWTKGDSNTLLGFMKRAINKPIETVYKNDNYIQTFGCAYEDDDIEQNSIRAVFRAIDQSLRNRRITARDNILGLLRSRPPRPDNLAREYTIYVNIVKNSLVEQARYEIKVLQLEVVPTFESKRSVWTRIISRYAYQDDFKNAPTPVDTPSDFVSIMQLAEDILEAAGKSKFKDANEILTGTKKPTFHPSDVSDLVFGDYLRLFSTSDSSPTDIPAIYVGKGIYIAKIPKFGSAVLKFGEERLFNLRLDTSSFQRPSSLFVNVQYRAPESVLQCILLRFGHKKPAFLPELSSVSR